MILCIPEDCQRLCGIVIMVRNALSTAFEKQMRSLAGFGLLLTRRWRFWPRSSASAVALPPPALVVTPTLYDRLNVFCLAPLRGVRIVSSIEDPIRCPKTIGQR